MAMSDEIRMTIRVPKGWHRKVKIMAALQEMTISWLVQTAVDEWIAKNPIKVKDLNREGQERQ